MNDLEKQLVDASQVLHNAALEFARLRKEAMMAYMTTHHPDIRYKIDTAEDTLLGLDVSFSGIEETQAKALAREMMDYLERLESERRIINMGGKPKTSTKAAKSAKKG